MLKQVRELLKYRELLYFLAMRGIKVRYKQSIIGIMWVVFQPLALMAVFTMISLIIKIPSEGIPYPVFFFSAIVPWSFFSASLNNGSLSLIQETTLITKIYFPREILPLSSLLVALFDFFISTCLFFVILFLFHIPFTPLILLFIPILLIQILLALGIILILASLNVFYRDIRAAVPLLTQIWMYACPIIYPLSLIPERFKTIYMLNPMAGIIESYRNVLVKGVAPDYQFLGIALVVSIVILLIGYKMFKSVERWFADTI